MAQIIATYGHLLTSMEGRSYTARACGRRRDEDGLWEGWLEFVPVAATRPILRTERETTQPNRKAVEYWSEGLEPVYLEGAFARAQVVAG